MLTTGVSCQPGCRSRVQPAPRALLGMSSVRRGERRGPVAWKGGLGERGTTPQFFGYRFPDMSVMVSIQSEYRSDWRQASRTSSHIKEFAAGADHGGGGKPISVLRLDLSGDLWPPRVSALPGGRRQPVLMNESAPPAITHGDGGATKHLTSRMSRRCGLAAQESWSCKSRA